MLTCQMTFKLNELIKRHHYDYHDPLAKQVMKITLHFFHIATIIVYKPFQGKIWFETPI